MKIFILAVTTFLFIQGCVTIYNPAMGRKEYYIFDEKAEVRWGAAIAQQFIAQNKMVYDEQLTVSLQELGDKIAQKSHRNYLQYHFYIIDKNVLNAFACPGGHIFVYRGLLERLDEDQLAFVLAHEIAHVCARHALKRLQATLGFRLLTAILLRKPDQKAAKNLAEQIYTIVSRGFSRSNEFQADSLGLQYTINAGFNPRGAIELFEIFKEEGKKFKGRRPPFYLRTHPSPDARIKNIKEKLKTMGYDNYN